MLRTVLFVMLLLGIGSLIPGGVGTGILCATAAGAETLVFHASQSGHRTLDEGEGGGNPFATALIELLERPTLVLDSLPVEMQRLTAQKSKGFQFADVPKLRTQSGYVLAPARAGERRTALIMVVADYALSGGAPSLPGARSDAARVAAALRRAGFDAELALDQGLAGMRATLAAFKARSQLNDAAVVYVTGHGVEVGHAIFLVPGDYPLAQRDRALTTRALPLAEIAEALDAKAVNLLFYGGCRDNPFGP